MRNYILKKYCELYGKNYNLLNGLSDFVDYEKVLNLISKKTDVTGLYDKQGNMICINIK